MDPQAQGKLIHFWEALYAEFGPAATRMIRAQPPAYKLWRDAWTADDARQTHEARAQQAAAQARDVAFCRSLFIRWP